ncbi:MAG: PHP domain-containing protein [Chloroflexota bacterium]|nr:PHP domain-containing protein [Chloroflexota bacterium]
MIPLRNEQTTKLPGLGVDFHMHTIASDGSWTPDSLVETAATQGIRIMTVSDHDSIKSVEPVSKLAQARGIQFITGVELTVDWKGAMYHLLLFNFDPSNIELNKMLADTQRQQLSKKEYIIYELKKLGYTLHKLDSFKRPNGDFLAIDIVRALQRGGEVKTFDEGLNICLKFGLTERICSQSIDKALQIGLAAGGLPVLAHPNRPERSFTIPTNTILHEFKAAGMAGLEAYHPSHTPEDIKHLVYFAKENDLVISCGSDSHNDARRPQPWNPELCRSLLERLDLEIPLPMEAEVAS